MKVTSEVCGTWYKQICSRNRKKVSNYEVTQTKMREGKWKGEEKQAIENSVVPRNENQGSRKAITQTFE